MATIAIKQPRRIDPSLIEIGDDIAVEHKETRGVTTTLRGIVSKQMRSGAVKYLLTSEGATLLAWEAGLKTGVKITLYGREEMPQETLFDDSPFEQIKERIAS